MKKILLALMFIFSACTAHADPDPPVAITDNTLRMVDGLLKDWIRDAQGFPGQSAGGYVFITLPTDLVFVGEHESQTWPAGTKIITRRSYLTGLGANDFPTMISPISSNQLAKARLDDMWDAFAPEDYRAGPPPYFILNVPNDIVIGSATIPAGSEVMFKRCDFYDGDEFQACPEDSLGPLEPGPVARELSAFALEWGWFDTWGLRINVAKQFVQVRQYGPHAEGQLARTCFKDDRQWVWYWIDGGGGVPITSNYMPYGDETAYLGAFPDRAFDDLSCPE